MISTRFIALSTIATAFAVGYQSKTKSTLVTAANSPVTFNKHIAPIIFEHCSNCHRSGEVAPFALLAYDDVKKRGKQIESVTGAHVMPPWKPAKGDIALLHDFSLSDDQIKLIGKWVQSGMKQGNAKDLPKLPEFTEGWQLGTPDLIVKMDRGYKVRADGRDIYRSFVVPLNLSEDKWLSAIEFRPQTRTVVHHCLFYFDATGELIKRDGQDGQPGFDGGMSGLGGSGGALGIGSKRTAGSGRGGLGAGLLNGLGGGGGNDNRGSLGGWAVGALPARLPEGLSHKLPKGSDLILATHFHPTGKAEEESSVVGLYFAKTPSSQTFAGIQLPPIFGVLKGIDIPAGAADYVIEDSYVLPADIRMFGVSAHAHYLAKEMKMTATLPDGTTKTLLSIPDWDFAWQGQYQTKEFVTLPKGTKLSAKIRYDNSTANPRNPSSPPKRVHWGEGSTDEMGSMMLQYVAAKPEELSAIQASYKVHIRDSFLERFKTK